MKQKKKRTTTSNINNLIGIIAGILWIYIGVTKYFSNNLLNIGIGIVGVVLIVTHLLMLKNKYFKKKVEK